MRKLLRLLEKEREKLYRLIIQDSNCAGHRAPSDAVIAQSRKVDAILSAVEKFKPMGKSKEEQKI